MHCDNDPALFDFESNSTRHLIVSLAKFQRFKDFFLFGTITIQRIKNNSYLNFLQ